MPKYTDTDNLTELIKKSAKYNNDGLSSYDFGAIQTNLDPEGSHVVFTSQQKPDGYVKTEFMMKIKGSPYPEFFTIYVSDDDYDALPIEEV